MTLIWVFKQMIGKPEM